MRVLIYETYRWTPHFETSLELMQQHLDNGDEVHYIGCNASLPACDINPLHEVSTCLNCMAGRSAGLKLLSGAYKRVSMPGSRFTASHQKLAELIDFDDMDSLKKLQYGSFDFGYAAASSFIFNRRDPAPDFNDENNRAMAERFCWSALKVYLGFEEIFEKDAYDRVYIFNGRFAPVRGVFRLCREKNIPCFLHERGATAERYEIYENHMPHSTREVRNTILDYWHRSDNKESRIIADSFYAGRAAGLEQAWFSFVANQKKDKLPGGWDGNKKNIVVFNSSEDEFSAIDDEWRCKLYFDQNEGISRIVDSLAKYPADYHVYVRVHPNLTGISNKNVSDLNSIQCPNFTIIPPDSDVSSYALMAAADKVVTFGSTMGIEAVYWGKPSILLGPSYYRDLGGVYLPDSHEELVEMLLSELVPLDRTGALIYGYYCSVFGRKFVYFSPKGLQDGSFKGVRLRDKTGFLEEAYQRLVPRSLKTRIDGIHLGLVT